MAHAVNQLDEKDIYYKHPGGYWDIMARAADCFAGLLFLAGLILQMVFIWHNV
jgi:hypothetical protein